MSENKSVIPNNLDNSIKLLLDTSLAIHDSMYGKSQNNQRHWFTCVNKFMCVYTGINNPEKFKEMFLNFYNSHKEHLDKPIFYDDEQGKSHVNDSFLKNNEKNDNNNKSNKSNSWSPKEITSKGIIIYYKPNEEKFKAIAIPISEIYQSAVKI